MNTFIIFAAQKRKVADGEMKCVPLSRSYQLRPSCNANAEHSGPLLNILDHRVHLQKDSPSYIRCEHNLSMPASFAPTCVQAHRTSSSIQKAFCCTTTPTRLVRRHRSAGKVNVHIAAAMDPGSFSVETAGSSTKMMSAVGALSVLTVFDGDDIQMVLLGSQSFLPPIAEHTQGMKAKTGYYFIGQAEDVQKCR